MLKQLQEFITPLLFRNCSVYAQWANHSPLRNNCATTDTSINQFFITMPSKLRVLLEAYLRFSP